MSSNSSARWVCGLLVLVASLLALPAIAPAQTTQPATPLPAQALLADAITKLADIIQPPADAPPRTWYASATLTQAQGLPQGLRGATAELAYQAPDRARLWLSVAGKAFAVGRDGQDLWVYAPDTHFGAVGRPGVARWADQTPSPDQTCLPAFRLPLALVNFSLPHLLTVQAHPPQTIGLTPCHVLQLTPLPAAATLLHLPPRVVLRLWLRQSDLLPLRIAYDDGEAMRLTLELHQLQAQPPLPAAWWRLPARPADTIQVVALSHLCHFISVQFDDLGRQIPPLGPAIGQRQLLATEGKGRLELWDGTRVLFLNGTPQEMGRQQGVLLRQQVHDTVNHILYGVGVGSSLQTGSWFLGQAEQADRRLLPFVAPAYLAEMDALAAAAGLDKQEVRLVNFFPELFHCSGFALFGRATAGGTLYHGRVLDYLRGVGLEQNAVVTVVRPAQGNAWVNVGYAGFLGSVTAMNQRHLAIGEMGGNGHGRWDGKPMAELVREVMERADTLDQAIAILRDSPRTCQYYYVISDGKSNRALGVAATPDSFQLIEPGRGYPQLPDAIPDALLVSADARYQTLAQRVHAAYGQLDAAAAMRLMARPVCMTSNIQSVLFAPQTLDFWVANADSAHVASQTRFTHYNLDELLRLNR